MDDRTCRGCDAVIIPGPRERNKRIWCSRQCCDRVRRAANPESRRTDFYRLRYLNCEICRTPMARKAGGRVRTCGEECRKVLGARRMRERYAEDPDFWKGRIATIRAALTPEQRAAERERAKRWREQAGYHESKRIGDQIRRARKAGATVEKFSPLEVFDRDGWMCGICGDPINGALAWPDPMSVSLDHVVPLVRGGAHSRANTQASHLVCNVRKHDN